MSSTPRRILLVVGLAALLVLAGCTGGGNDAASGGADAEMTQTGGGDAAAEATTQEDAANGGDGGNAPPDGESFSADAAQDRDRIRTGRTVVLVDDFESATSELTAATRRMGGFVADTERQRHTRENASWLTGTLVLRVPSAEFGALREQVAAQGTVQQSSSDVRDVTGRIVDIEARLDNLRAERDRLRALYERANETEDVLAVGERLSETQEEIERLEGQLASLENRVAYSTLTVELREPEPELDDDPEPETDAWYETGVVTAFLDSVEGVVTTLRMLVVAGAYLVPFAAVFGAPVVGVLAWRRWRNGGGSGEVADASAFETQADPSPGDEIGSESAEAGATADDAGSPDDDVESPDDDAEQSDDTK